MSNNACSAKSTTMNTGLKRPLDIFGYANASFKKHILPVRSSNAIAAARRDELV